MIALFSTAKQILWKSVVSEFKPTMGSVHIGRYTYHTPTIVSFLSTDKVVIGSFCSIAADVLIIASGEHKYDRVSTFPLKSRLAERKEVDTWSKGPVVIGNDVWVGARSTILSGVRIGDGALIGAGSVVTRDIPAYAIAAGAPAKVIGFRFTKSQIEKLRKIAWWDWSEEKIVRNISYFYGDVEDFVNKFYQP